MTPKGRTLLIPFFSHLERREDPDGPLILSREILSGGCSSLDVYNQDMISFAIYKDILKVVDRSTGRSIDPTAIALLVKDVGDESEFASRAYYCLFA